MAVFRKVYCDFWEDRKIMEELTPEDRFFMLYLLTNPDTKQIGIYEFSKKKAAFRMGYQPESIDALLDRFENHHKIIKFNGATSEIAIIHWGKYNLDRGGKPVEDCIKSELLKIKDKSLILYITEHIQNDKLRKIFYDFYESGKVEFLPSRGQQTLSPITVRDYVISRDESICFYTGKKLKVKDIEIDHIIPASDGGPSSPDNLVTTSRKLNNLKSANDLKWFCNKVGLDYAAILKKIEELKAFEEERVESGATYRDAIEGKFTLRKFKNTLRAQEEEEEKEEEEEYKHSPHSTSEDEPKFGIDSMPFKMSLLLREKILENNPRAVVPSPDTASMEKWSAEMDRLNRLGAKGGSQGYSWTEIGRIIDWCQNDNFWKSNILSVGKLRAKIITLENQMKRQPPKKPKREPEKPKNQLGVDFSQFREN